MIMSTNKNLRKALVFPLILLLITSCKKQDIASDRLKPGDDFYSRFFGAHPATDYYGGIVVNFMKREWARGKLDAATLQKLGWPHWEKIIFHSNKNLAGRTTADSSYTVAYIPIIQNGANTVNAQLAVKMTGSDTLCEFVSASQYDEFGFLPNDTTELNGLKVFTLFARHEQNVFGRTKFRLLDNRILLGQTALQIDPGKQYVLELDTSASGSRALAAPTLPHSSCMTVNEMIEGGYTVNYYMVGSVCIISSYSLGGGFGTGGGGGSGGGGGGGSFLPNGDSGGGWQPYQYAEKPYNPCDTVNAYAQGQDFQTIFKRLKLEVPTRHEHMYVFNNLLIPGSPVHQILGHEDDFGVIPPDESVMKSTRGWFHNHFADADSAGLIFSAGDINLLAEMVVRDSANFKLNYQNFMIGVVSDSNAQYIIMVENIGKFITWSNMLKNETDIGNWYGFWGLTHEFLPLSLAETEKRFLKATHNSGLRLMRGSNDFKIWTGIKLDPTGNNVTTVDACKTITVTL